MNISAFFVRALNKEVYEFLFSIHLILPNFIQFEYDFICPPWIVW